VRREGVATFVQANSVPFSDREHLPAIVAKQVKTAGWRSTWQRELSIELPTTAYMDAIRTESDALDNAQRMQGRFFHGLVRNLDPKRVAQNCYVYLEKILDITAKKSVPLETAEFKWAGYVFPNAIIGPGSSRRFDAFWIQHTDPKHVRFNSFADSSAFH